MKYSTFHIAVVSKFILEHFCYVKQCCSKHNKHTLDYAWVLLI